MSNIEDITLKGESKKSVVVNSETQIEEEKELPKQNKLPKLTEASQIFETSLKLLSLFGILVGANMNYQWRHNPRFFFTKFLIALFSSQILYTQSLHIYNHNGSRTLEQFAMYGVLVSAVLKIKCFDVYFKNITALFNATIKICQQNSGRRAEMLTKRLLSNFIFYKILCFSAPVVVVVYVYNPLKSYITEKKLVSFIPIEIMFIDQSNTLEFFIANAIILLMAIYAVVGSVYIALSFVMLIMNYSLYVDIVNFDFKELDELWRNTSTSTLAYREMCLRNICQKFLDIRLYIAEVKKIFDEKLFMFFIFAYLSEIVCLYEIQLINWIPGYAFALGLFLEMIFYCMMGTKVNIEITVLMFIFNNKFLDKNERLCFIISQSNWYMYDGYSQKLILTLLNIAMNNKELWIGPFQPLSVFTATEIVKSIYSYYTIMMEIM